MKKNRGKVISGVYISESGERRVMTRNQFKRVLLRKGGGSGKSKPTKWRKYRAAKKGK